MRTKADCILPNKISFEYNAVKETTTIVDIMHIDSRFYRRYLEEKK